MTDARLDPKTPIVELRDISKRFVKRLDLAGKLAQKLGAGIQEEVVHAVDSVSLSIFDGEVVGLVGESGCGKSVSALSILRLIANPPGEITGGKINFMGQDLLQLSDREIREIRERPLWFP